MSLPTDHTPERIAGTSAQNPVVGSTDTTTGSAAGNTAPRMPSEVVKPKRTDTIPQQASTTPGDGSAEHANKPKFTERVIGVAQRTRGSVMNNPALKEHGEKILEGEASAKDPKSEI